MATLKKVFFYQQFGNEFYRTINNQPVPYVNVRVSQQNKALRFVTMSLEKFNNLGYERDPDHTPKIIAVQKEDSETFDRISIENGIKQIVYEKIGNSFRRRIGSQDIRFVNLKIYETGVPTKYKSMRLDDFEKLVIPEGGPPTDIIIARINERKTMNNQILNRLYVIVPYPLVISTAEHIARWAFNLKNEIVEEATRNNPGGYHLKFKIIYQSETGGYASSSFSAEDLLDKYIQKTESLARKNYDAKDYFLYLKYVDVIIASLPVEGGCSAKNSSVEKIKRSKYELVELHNPKSTNNNCLFAVFNLIAGLKGNENKPDNLRKKLGIPLKTKIHIDQVPMIADYYKKNYILVNEKYEIINQMIYDNNEKINYIYLRNEHYSLMEIIKYKNCEMCGAFVNEAKHKKCCASSVSYKQRYRLGKKNIVKVKKITDDNKIDYNKIIHLDIETFQETIRHVPYSCGWYNKTYKCSYGKNCFDEFLDDVLNEKDKIINAYNGSGFDFYFLIDKIEDRGIHVEKILLSNGKAISFKFGNNIKVFDLYLFMNNQSLSDACEDFKIKNAKTFFDHKLIKSWQDTEKYKEEVKKYNKKDVEALKELFETFNDIVYERYKINICKFVTLPHLAWELWASKLKEIIEITTDMEKYKFITLAKYGGRCYPMGKDFKSKLYNDILMRKVTYNQLLKTGNFIFNSDCSGLYPASMSGNDLMKVVYPTGFSRWSDKPEEEWKNSKIGFYKIKYFPPKNIRVPMLPSRRNQTISWDLLDGEGIYTSVDIQNALDVGYRVEFQGKCLVWDSSANIFGEFIQEFATLKSEAEKSGNSCLRAIAKLIMNALYGKTLQKAIFSKTKIVHNIFEFNEFVRKYGNNFDWEYLNDNRMIVTGDVNEVDKEKYITKPCQLGCFVTAYSRRLMLRFMQAIDPTLQTRIFEYTDTDSLHILGPAYFKLRDLGYIVDKENSKLGYLCSDIKNEGLIISAKYLGPKCYTYHYIDNKNQIASKDEDEIIRCPDCTNKEKLCRLCKSACSVKKCKGIPKDKLKNRLYDLETPEEISFSGLKKKHKNLTHEDIEKGVKPFSIIENDLTRTFMKNPWKGMQLINNEYYPIGYKF